MSKPNFAKILKYRYFILFGLLFTFVYNILKGKNWAEILFTEIIVVLLAYGVFVMGQLCKGEEKDLIPGEEDVKLRENNYISNKEATKFYKKLRSSHIDEDIKPLLILIQNELNNKLNK